jgi:NCS1 family nucleobase:cation symporter-1
MGRETIEGRKRPPVEAPRGIDPIPPEHRSLSGFDLAVLWGDLGIGVLVLVTGGLLVPGLGFARALLAIVLGSVVGAGLLALIGVAGARHGIPTMVLFRPLLGRRGSWIPSALNAGQLIGWTAVEFWAMSFVADLVSRTVFGFSARWLWLALAASLCTLLALWGPVGVTRVWMKKFGAWMTVAICAAVTALVLTRRGIYDAVTAPGSGGWPGFGAAMDLVIAMPISWLPLVADYTRFATEPRAAFRGTFFGYLVANIWLYALGALLVLGTGASPDPAGVATGVLAIAGGSVAGILFLTGLLVGETDEAFADIYSGSLSLQNVWPDASQRTLTLGIAAVATVLAAWLTMERYEAFLFLIGSVFVPLFGILTADYFILSAGAARGRFGALDFDHVRVRWTGLLPWASGFLVYHWISPTGPERWVGAVEALSGTPLGERWPLLSASIPSFAVALVVTLIIRGVDRER